MLGGELELENRFQLMQSLGISEGQRLVWWKNRWLLYHPIAGGQYGIAICPSLRLILVYFDVFSIEENEAKNQQSSDEIFQIPFIVA